MDTSGDELHELRKVIEVLRGPGGCPWDREQTLPDIARYLVEESSEAADAIEDAGGHPVENVRDELGDVLVNILLAARIAEEAGAFSLDDIARAMREKLVRRHPHVFGDARAETSDEVLVHWEEAKARERAGGDDAALGPRSRLDGVPRHLPPLARAWKMSSRAAKSGFDWPDWRGSLAKLREEIAEAEELLEAVPSPGETGAGTPAEHLEEELGDVLFAAVNLCRQSGVHPDRALRRTLRKFRERFEYIERRLPDLERATLEDMDRLWNEARRPEPPDGPGSDPTSS